MNALKCRTLASLQKQHGFRTTLPKQPIATGTPQFEEVSRTS